MLDIHNLERRWLIYKAKSFAPYVIGLFLSILLLFVFTYSRENSTVSKVASTIDQTSRLEEKKGSNAHRSGKVSSDILEPSMEFIQSFQATTSPVSTPPSSIPKHVQPSSPIPAPKVLNVPDSSSLKVSSESLPPLNDKSVSLNRNESKFDMENIERRFKESSNPNLGLFIARYYYNHGNYNNAYNFALKTNSINNKIDECWIIFAKSLVKLGKTDQAKKTLQLYISESNSDSARALLDSIEQGTFK